MTATDATQPRAGAALTFSATTSTYVRIAAVNAALSLVTLGLYGPWAKVRTTRFIALHLTVPDHTIAYDQNPWPILARRIMGVVLLLIPSALYDLAPIAAWAGFALSVALFPLVIVWGWRDRAAAYSVDGVPCRYEGGYWSGLLFGVGCPLMTFASSGLLSFLSSAFTWRALPRQHIVLGVPFTCAPSMARLFGCLLWAVVLTLPITLLLVVGPYLAAVVYIRDAFQLGPHGQGGGILLTVMSMAFVLIGAGALVDLLIRIGVYITIVRLTALGTLSHPAGALRVQMPFAHLSWILFSNAVLNLITLGVAIPVTRMRLWRVMIHSITLEPPRADK